MCGIFGAVDPGLRREDLMAMRTGLAHRGPDDSGLDVWAREGVALGHTRLSIVDLTPAGRNPLGNEDGTVWVTFNGEIYNHRALRRELEAHGHVFRSRSDTEVLVHAYEEWGDDHVARLQGMFAYALYDRRPLAGRRGRILLVRDRLGIKPLYYCADGTRFLFASEIGPLLRAPGIDTTPDLTAVADYLTYRYIPAPKTHMAKIRKLPPASLLELGDDGRPEIRRYWTLRADPVRELASPPAAREALEAALRAAVARHLVSDVPVGVLLSGGLDSSGVAALAVESGAAGLASFALGFDVPGKEDLAAARVVSRHLSTTHHEGVASLGSLERTLPAMATIYGEPFADGSAIPTTEVCRLASRYVKVALSGDGGDELFGGYTHYRRWLRRERYLGGLPAILRQTMTRALRPVVRPADRHRRMAALVNRDDAAAYGALLELFSPEEKRRLAGPALGAILPGYEDHWLFTQHWRADLDPLTRAQYLDLHTFLVDDILTKVDRAAMSCGLEVRPVLLDHELVELAFSMPAAIRSGRDGLDGKRVLREVLRDRLPPEILARRKSGFGAPLDAWLAASQDQLVDALATGRLVDQGILSSQGVRRLAPILGGLRLWALLMLERTWT